MTNYYQKYIDLLIRQVEEELNYLSSVGHEKRTTTRRCIFCFKLGGQNIYACNRFSELESFIGYIKELKIKFNGEKEEKPQEQKVITNNSELTPLMNPF